MMDNPPNDPVAEAGARVGRIVTRFGAYMLVEDAAGGLYRCTARRRLARAVCGDLADWVRDGREQGIVTALRQRRNEIARHDRHGRRKVIAANVDQLLVVTAPLPRPRREMVDRYLVTAANLPAEAVLVLNKSELCDEATAETLQEYAALGYPVIPCSAHTGAGMAALTAALKAKTSILVGQSGVGKSSLIQALHPQANIRIGALSRVQDSGTHTTTRATLYHLPQGGELIDSPGVRDFDLPPLSIEGLARGFPEFALYLGQCRFHNCSHTTEPDCALVKAARGGRIGPRRLQSYQRLASRAGRRARA
jgi:ribosome biogenesis GTPase